jgi:predicted nucleic acid-binding protein
MNLLISDTNILIDLYNGNLLDKIKQLPYKFGIPDAILSDAFTDKIELHEPGVEEILDAGFRIYSLEADELVEVYSLNESYSHLSVIDIFGLVLAKKHKAILLTGDKKLRQAAQNKGIEFKGILWILDELIENSIINKETATGSLQKILDKGAYLPKVECQKRFENWKK